VLCCGQTEFGALEKKHLFRVLNSLPFGGDGYAATCSNLQHAATACLQAAHATVQRCVQLSCAVETESAVNALSEFWTEFVQRIFSLLRRIRKLAALDGTSSAAASAVASPSAAAAGAAPGKDLRYHMRDGGRMNPELTLSDVVVCTSNVLSDNEDWSGFEGAFQLLRTARHIKADLDRYCTALQHSPSPLHTFTLMCVWQVRSARFTSVG
jgi:hypothetical protein